MTKVCICKINKMTFLVELPKKMIGETFVVRFDTMCRSKKLTAQQHSFFACIAFGIKQIKQNSVKICKQLFKEGYPDQRFHSFAGVPCTRKDIKRLATTYNVSVRVYVLSNAEGFNKRLKVSCTVPNSTRAVNLLYYNNIYSYISNIEKFIGQYVCSICNKGLKTMPALYRHKKRVHFDSLRQIKTISKKGAYQCIQNLKDLLCQCGIPNRYVKNVSYPCFAVFDIESCLEKIENTFETFGGPPLITSEHVPMAIGIQSNFTSRTKIFVTEKGGIHIVSMIDKFIKHLIKLSQRAKKLYRQRTSNLIRYLRDGIEQYTQFGQMENVKRFQNLIKRVKTAGRILPVLGYNSSRYDLQVLQYYGFFALLMKRDGIKRIIKKNGFILVKTDHLKFLDAMRYLAPGYSLRKFIQSFAPSVKLGKMWFPYEYISSLKKLNNRHFPPYDAFYSSLRKVNVLNEENEQYNDLLKKGIERNYALRKLNLTNEPPNGRKRYMLLKKLWRKKGMKTLKDFLKMYLTHDLKPFMVAVQNMLNFYLDRGIEVFVNHSTKFNFTAFIQKHTSYEVKTIFIPGL